MDDETPPDLIDTTLFVPDLAKLAEYVAVARDVLEAVNYQLRFADVLGVGLRRSPEVIALARALSSLETERVVAKSTLGRLTLLGTIRKTPK